MSSISEKFKEHMNKTTENLVSNSKFIKETAHVVFDKDKVEFPEGITNESLGLHVDFINDTNIAVESATAEIARREFESNEELTTVDSTLDFGNGLVFNSQHFLKQNIGDTDVFGQSTTVCDFTGNTEQTALLKENRDNFQKLASNLFNK